MSTVIKASSPSRGDDAATFNFEDIGDKAKDYLDRVRRQAAEILTKAQNEAVEIRKAAEEQGRASAREAAEKLVDERVGRQLTTLLPALADCARRLDAARAQWLMHWEQTAVHVAAAMASRVIRRELTRTPEITLALVREALELAAGSGEIQLRLHPDDVATLGSQIGRLKNELARLGKAEIVADGEIERGGCRVDTRFGTIDQQFAAQLDRMEQELK